MRHCYKAKQVRLDQYHSDALALLSREMGVNESDVIRLLIGKEVRERDLAPPRSVTTLIRGAVRCPVCHGIGALSLTVKPGTSGESWSVEHGRFGCQLAGAQAVAVLRAVS